MWLWLTSRAGARILVNFARVNEVYPDTSGAILYFGTIDGDAGETDTKVQESVEAIAEALNAKPLK